MEDKVILEEATRNQLIKELRKRISISSIHIPIGEGAVIKHSKGNISVSGESNIFVIEPNKKELSE